MKVHDDKSVQYRGNWLAAKPDSRGKTTKILESMISIETLMVISAFLLTGQILLIVITHNPIWEKLVGFK
jgi:hypothetical protein